MPPKLLDSAAKDFVAAFDALVAAKREIVDDVGAQVAAIVADVRHRGDAALVDYTRRFDKFDVTEATLRDRKSTRLNSSHSQQSRMPSSA